MLFDKTQIGGIDAKCRIIRSATFEGMADTNGFPTERLLQNYATLADGGSGIIITGMMAVSPMEPHQHSQIRISSDNCIEPLQKLTACVHEHGGKVVAQLVVMGSAIALPEGSVKAISPSGIQEKVVTTEGPLHILETKEIKQLVQDMAKAVVRARKAGFDGIQIHGAHGYLASKFLTPYFNHRTDEYGGSAERRARFAVEAVKAVHAAVPGMAIDYKLAVRQENPHYGNAGVVEEELAVFVPLLVQAGVTSFHVTLANHSALENTIPPASHPEFKETGCFLKFCDEVRRYTSVPLCGVGGLNDPDFVEQQLASGRIQCAAMCRQLLADPNWVNKLQSGNAAKIHRCVRCNKKCLGGLIAHQGTRCIYDALNAKEQGSI